MPCSRVLNFVCILKFWYNVEFNSLVNYTLNEGELGGTKEDLQNDG